MQHKKASILNQRHSSEYTHVLPVLEYPHFPFNRALEYQVLKTQSIRLQIIEYQIIKHKLGNTRVPQIHYIMNHSSSDH